MERLYAHIANRAVYAVQHLNFLQKRKKRNNEDIDYRVIFVMGIILISAGVTFLAALNRGFGAAFMGTGVLFMLIGMNNKDKWKK